MSNKFIVAIKDSSHHPGPIRQGKFLGKYRSKDSAWHAIPGLAARQNLQIWELGVFVNGKLQD